MAVGLRYTIRRDSDDGEVRKEIYLATCAPRDLREKMAKAKRDFRKASFEMQAAAQRWGAVRRQVSLLDPATAGYEALIERQETAFALVRTTEDAAYDAAECIVRCSLARNYEGKTDEIMEAISQKDLLAMVTLINTGELPKDFFLSPVQEQRPTSISAPGGSPDTSSENTDTASDS
jgi:hypothetical protein